MNISGCRHLNVKAKTMFLLQSPNSTTESTDNELAEMCEREFRSLLLKMMMVLKRVKINDK
jgi:hypothetical protein